MADNRLSALERDIEKAGMTDSPEWADRFV
jgi:hypothetical protein